MSRIRYFAILFSICVGAIAGAQDLEDAVVYTVRVPLGINMSDDQLKALALTRGTVELLRFFEDAALERLIIRMGDEGLACPGFTSLNREAASEAVAKGAKRVKSAGGEVVSQSGGGVSVAWTLPENVGGAPFQAEVTWNGKLAYRETRQEQALRKGTDASVRPVFVRVDYNDDETIVQFYDWDALPPGDWIDPYDGFANGTSKVITSTSFNDPAKSIRRFGCRFHSMHGWQFDWDSGYWPGGGTSPGSFPLQVRLAVGAGWARGGDLNGEFIIDDANETLSLGMASGEWWVDYGAELSLVAALNIPMLPPITLDIDQLIADQIGLPTFDMRWQQSEVFNSYALDAGVPIANEFVRRNLFTFDIVDAILASAGVSLPSWVPLSAGVKLDGSLEGIGTLQGDSITLSDGTVFTAERETRPIDITSTTYSATAQYDAHIDMTAALHAFPALFAEVLFTRFDLPLGDLVLPIPIGQVDLEFDPCEVRFENLNYHPDPEGNSEGEGAAEGEGEGEQEGSWEGGVEGEGEGEGEGESEGAPEGEGEIEGSIACGAYSSGDEALPISDMNRTILTIEVPDSGAIESLEVWLDLHHPHIGDLSVLLQSPKGTNIDLFSLVGGASQDMRDTTFADDAFLPIRSAAGPYGGRYEPFDPLGNFRGENARGTWKLIINDLKQYNTGVLLGWNLLVNPCAPEGEGVAEGEGEGESEGAAEGEGEGEGEGTVDPEGEGQPAQTRPHSLDFAPRDQKISLDELLRAIQLYNSGYFSCDETGEDGFRIGLGKFECFHHALDFAPADWLVSLDELLRGIQFYNSGGYHPEAGTEDGYGPGIA